MYIFCTFFCQLYLYAGIENQGGLSYLDSCSTSYNA